MENVGKSQVVNNTAGKSAIFWAVVAFLLTKGAVILKALKALKYAKFLITAVTMSLSAILYGFAFGSWYFAIGIVLLLLVHEYGHVVAMWKKGIKASAPVFIPFLGAAIFAEIPDNKDDEAYIGYGGPLIGTAGAIACIAVAFTFPSGSFWSTLLHILGNVGLFINLFNLIPARPLDGGRILHPIGGGVVYCGFALLLILALVVHDLMFVLIALFAVDNMPVRRFVTRMLYGMWWVALGINLLFLYQGWISYSLLFLIFAFATTSFYLAWDVRNKPLPPAVIDPEPVSLGIKIKWLTCYVLLLAFIGGTMMWHTRHLPAEVRESSLVKFIKEF